MLLKVWTLGCKAASSFEPKSIKNTHCIFLPLLLVVVAVVVDNDVVGSASVPAKVDVNKT